MPKISKADANKRFDPRTPAGNDEPEGKRSSPGSGEDEDVNGTADLQPDDVEGGDTAR